MIVTQRLELLPSSSETLVAALHSPQALAAALGAEVPLSWPPDFLDAPALQFVLDRVTADPGAAPWWFYFVILRDLDAERVVIGTAGYKGPPDAEGTVEIGYGIVSDRRRRGYAAEAAGALIEHAFADPAVGRVIAETYPELTGSIGVLKRCGFEEIGPGSEPRVIRFALSRRAWSKMRSKPRGGV